MSSLKVTRELSKDNETKVSALIIDCERKIILSSGYNGLPRGVLDIPNRLTRPEKYNYTIHAELNAILWALSNGKDVVGKTLISSLAPCCACTSIICQVGIKEIVSPKFDMSHVSCGHGYTASINMLNECGIKITEIEL